MLNFRTEKCCRWQARGKCHCCEFDTNWIALTNDECDFIHSASYSHFSDYRPILDASGNQLGMRVRCDWRPAVKGQCPWRPFDCRLYPYSPARLLDASGNVCIEWWVGDKCPLYQHDTASLLAAIPHLATGILLMSAQDKIAYDAWFRTVTPLMEGYVPFLTWRI